MKYGDWYQVRKQQVMKRGRHLFRHYSTLEEALRAVYPEFEWKSHLFIDFQRAKFNRPWSDPIKQLAHLEMVAQELGIKQVRLNLKEFFSFKKYRSLTTTK